jgi:hypothetical protein
MSNSPVDSKETTTGFWKRLGLAIEAMSEGWQLCRGISGSIRVEWVAGFVWNQWQAWSGIRIRVRIERQVDLLGDTRTSISRIALHYFNDGFESPALSGKTFLRWSLRPWFPSTAR